MTTHQEHEVKAPTSDKRNADDSAAPPKAELMRARLKLIGNYAMLAFAPVVAVVALVIAVLAVNGSQSGREQLDKANARIDSLNSGLSASRGELEKFKAAVSKENSLRNEDIAKRDERMAKIVQNITPLQTKLKISPTLEEQLRQAASAVAAASAVPTSAVAAPVAASTGADKKPSPQVRAMKEAIEKYNKK
ncbi:MAG: hypothetical protein EPO42_08560 [Gallionellaceae bacterium]|nr:MAG: hypothetical protein EPO42_08560 [Gallionellaceae bacterium]